MALSGSRLHTLGDLAGLARVYTNAWGDEQPIADETLRTLLTALGLGADTEAVAGSSVAEIDAPLKSAGLQTFWEWRRHVPAEESWFPSSSNSQPRYMVHCLFRSGRHQISSARRLPKLSTS